MTIVAIDVIVLCVLMATCPLWINWLADSSQDALAALRRLWR